MRLHTSGFILSAALALAGIGHNMPPAYAAMPTTTSKPQAVLPKRIVDENRRNQKLKQKLRRKVRRQMRQRFSRAELKTMKFGSGYRAGKLFKGHRI
jgi:hypothetical protein